MNDAENILGSGVITRVTKEAAIAFKTRVYLHMGRWNDVITEGNKLSGFTLTSDPNEPFISGYKNTESIFSLENSATNNPGVNAALASQYKRRTLVAISPIIWRDPSWLPDDKRRRELPHSDATDVQDDAMVFTIDGAKYTNKYKDGRDYTDPSPIIRYAEVVLSMAEAHARKASPDLPQALTLLNSVRNRSLANPATQAYTIVDLPTQSDMIQAIIKERRIEFLMEGRRWRYPRLKE